MLLNLSSFPLRKSLGAVALLCSFQSLADSVTIYEYDARGRLIKVADNTSKTMYYTYDEAGNRVQVGNTIATVTPVITSFSAPTSVSSGALATISWTSQNATYCDLAIFGDNSDYPSLPTSGSESIRIYENTGVSVTCYNGAESDSEGKIIQISGGGGKGGIN